MRLTAASTLPEVAVTVGSQLRRRGVTAVLTGGACVAVYTDGSYVSKDADFVIQGRTQQSTLDEALADLGFVREGDRFVHPLVRFDIEFPPGPLAIGADLAIQPVGVVVGNEVALALFAAGDLTIVGMSRLSASPPTPAVNITDVSRREAPPFHREPRAPASRVLT